MQRILGGAAIGFALSILTPAREAATFRTPAYQLNYTIVDRLAQLDRSELRCLALNIYYEARGEQPQGQLAVAHVTLNRLHDPRFPKTICKVVYQPGAFSWTADPENNHEEVRKEQAWELAVAIAQMAMSGISDDPTNGAMDFHATWIHPWWVADKEMIRQLGHHKFYARQAAAKGVSTAISAKYVKLAPVRKVNKRKRTILRPLQAPSLFGDRRDMNELLDTSAERTNIAADRLQIPPTELFPLKEHG